MCESGENENDMCESGENENNICESGENENNICESGENENNICETAENESISMYESGDKYTTDSQKSDTANELSIGELRREYTDKMSMSQNGNDDKSKYDYSYDDDCYLINGNDIIYYDKKIFVESICKKKTCVRIYIDKKKMRESQNYDSLMDDLEICKKKKCMLHRNVEKDEWNYKIYLIKLTNVYNNNNNNNNNSDDIVNKRMITMNNILFEMNDEMLNDYIYVNVIEDTEEGLLIDIELLAYLPFHCNFFLMIKKKMKEKINGDKKGINILSETCNGKDINILPEYKDNNKYIINGVEKNCIFVEIFNYLRICSKYINIFVDKNLCSEKKLNIYYKNNSDSYFNAYMINYNEYSTDDVMDEILNYDIKPSSGVLKHNKYNKFIIIRTNKNGVVNMNNIFLLLIKTERKIFSYIIFSHYKHTRTICTMVKNKK
ncbi:hypothetical protein PFUGPA_05944 [Plasmodium falciparum Palo Alto/Uganda]|nr:hypothetical protein PFUGPA_05944 [Plasmodium falciparum Palo Alto/Uganda]